MTKKEAPKREVLTTWDWDTDEFDHDFERFELKVVAVVADVCDDNDNVAEAVIEALKEATTGAECLLKSIVVTLVKREKENVA